jgi:hypothetical protein
MSGSGVPAAACDQPVRTRGTHEPAGALRRPTFWGRFPVAWFGCGAARRGERGGRDCRAIGSSVRAETAWRGRTSRAWSHRRALVGRARDRAQPRRSRARPAGVPRAGAHASRRPLPRRVAGVALDQVRARSRIDGPALGEAPDRPDRSRVWSMSEAMDRRGRTARARSRPGRRRPAGGRSSPTREAGPTARPGAPGGRSPGGGTGIPPSPRGGG